MTITPLGDAAFVLCFGAGIDQACSEKARAAAELIRRRNWPGLTDVVPAFGSVGLYFRPGQAPEPAEAQQRLAEAIAEMTGRVELAEGRFTEIPVCYGGAHGPDLDVVAAHTGLAAEEVIRRHAAAEYYVHAIGFAPGFPYLGGLPGELCTPRRASPRPRVPAGSIGIGGAQTGVYPHETPGGWNLIGRTPVRLFDPRRERPSLLQAGDRVRFRAIASEDFRREGAGDEEIRLSSEGILVERAGALTTVQDLGRPGWRAEGVPVGGAADAVALRVANLLVGNDENAPALEITSVGPRLRFREEAWVAVTGAEFDGIPMGRPFRVEAGGAVDLGVARRGFRGYLAIAGGVAVAAVLGSASTEGRAGFGGFRGRALREGDVLPSGTITRRMLGRWQVDPRVLAGAPAECRVRVLPGAQGGEFSRAWLETSYRVNQRSDRMGLRLEGVPLSRAGAEELVSSPVAPGTIQVPPDGQPIVLLADAQTIGGYPQLAHVATVDLPQLAQLRPGDTLSFREVSLAEARAALATREHSLAMLHEGLQEKWR